jgi:hypothetical protein
MGTSLTKPEGRSCVVLYRWGLPRLETRQAASLYRDSLSLLFVRLQGLTQVLHGLIDRLDGCDLVPVKIAGSLILQDVLRTGKAVIEAGSYFGVWGVSLRRWCEIHCDGGLHRNWAAFFRIGTVAPTPDRLHCRFR